MYVLATKEELSSRGFGTPRQRKRNVKKRISQHQGGNSLVCHNVHIHTPSTEHLAICVISIA